MKSLSNPSRTILPSADAQRTNPGRVTATGLPTSEDALRKLGVALAEVAATYGYTLTAATLVSRFPENARSAKKFTCQVSFPTTTGSAKSAAGRNTSRSTTSRSRRTSRGNK